MNHVVRVVYKENAKVTAHTGKKEEKNIQTKSYGTKLRKSTRNQGSVGNDA